MADYSHIFFNKSPLQLRLVGARGGKAHGRNQRARRALIALMPTPPQAAPLCAAIRQTTAEAVALLEAQKNSASLCGKAAQASLCLRNLRPSSAG